MADDREFPSGSTRKPTLQETVRAGVEAGRLLTFTTMPGVVSHYDPDKNKSRVTVKPLLMQAYADEDDNRQVESLPPIAGVPIVFLGAGGFRLTCPISDGTQKDDDGNVMEATTGLLLFAMFSLDKWLTGNGDEVDPQIDHSHDLTDAIFLPGLRSFGNPWGSIPGGHASLGHDAGVQAHYHKNMVVVADVETDAKFVALANLVKDRLDTIQNAHDVHKHSTPSGTSGVPDTLIGTLADVAAQQLKAK